MKLSAMLCASLTAMAAFALSAGGAVAQGAVAPNKCTASPFDCTCEEFVTFTDGGSPAVTGIEPLGTKSVSGVVTGKPTTIENAASACHEATRIAFMNNLAWSDPYQVCLNSNGRKFKGETRTVWAIDRFKEISETPQLYNRVLGYTVKCDPSGVVLSFTPINALAGGVKPF
jgi:hypothetical protein